MANPKQSFVVDFITRADIASEFNELYDGDVVFRKDDDRLTDKLCQEFAAELRKILVTHVINYGSHAIYGLCVRLARLYDFPTPTRGAKVIVPPKPVVRAGPPKSDKPMRAVKRSAVSY